MYWARAERAIFKKSKINDVKVYLKDCMFQHFIIELFNKKKLISYSSSKTAEKLKILVNELAYAIKCVSLIHI